MNKKLSVVLRWAVLIFALVLIYLPLAVIVIYSFSSSREIGGEFGQFTFSLYAKLFEDEDLLQATLNTLLIGLASAFFATILGTLAAIGIHYMRKAKKPVEAVSQITVVNAEIVTAIGFFLLSLFLRDVVQLPIERGVGWLILAHTILTTPYVILAVSPRLKQLNPHLLEASMDLGAGPTRSLITVMLPQLIGGMISGFALAFTLSLDDFVVTNFNKGSSGVHTISTYVYLNFKRNLNPAVRALSTILFLVVLLVLIVFNVVKNKKAKNEKH